MLVVKPFCALQHLQLAHGIQKQCCEFGLVPSGVRVGFVLHSIGRKVILQLLSVHQVIEKPSPGDLSGSVQVWNTISEEELYAAGHPGSRIEQTQRLTGLNLEQSRRASLVGCRHALFNRIVELGAHRLRHRAEIHTQTSMLYFASRLIRSKLHWRIIILPWRIIILPCTSNLLLRSVNQNRGSSHSFPSLLRQGNFSSKTCKLANRVIVRRSVQADQELSIRILVSDQAIVCSAAPYIFNAAGSYFFHCLRIRRIHISSLLLFFSPERLPSRRRSTEVRREMLERSHFN